MLAEAECVHVPSVHLPQFSSCLCLTQLKIPMDAKEKFPHVLIVCCQTWRVHVCSVSACVQTLNRNTADCFMCVFYCAPLAWWHGNGCVCVCLLASFCLYVDGGYSGGGGGFRHRGNKPVPGRKTAFFLPPLPPPSHTHTHTLFTTPTPNSHPQPSHL